ncbi:MAG: glycosyltransferase family 4 protein [Planctomycetota bacterium]|jgi:glycosyltransferase involved in cell wall biosynthesis
MIFYITTIGIGTPWVATELWHMQQRGIPCCLTELRRDGDRFFRAAWAREIDDRTHTLYPLPAFRFLLSMLAAPLLFRGRLLACLWNGLTGPRESLRGRVVSLWHLLVACHWARMIRRSDLDLIHSQWIHSAGTVGMYAAWLLEVPFSFTGHAADLFRDRVALDDKIRRAAFIVCISEFHRRFYLDLGADPRKLHVVYCGLDPDEIEPGPDERPADRRPRLLSIGRLCEKKGFDVLIDACRMLADRGRDFECVIAGSGELESALRDQVRRLELDDHVEITGKALHQEDLGHWLMQGDFFVQPCIVARDGDMDGTPRTIMEAMLCRRPTISTTIAGIPEIVVDGRTGLLAEPGRADEVADAVERLMDDPELARRLGEAGRDHILRTFSLPRCLDPLAEQFGIHAGVDADPPRGTVETRSPAPALVDR